MEGERERESVKESVMEGEGGGGRKRTKKW